MKETNNSKGASGSGLPKSLDVTKDVPQVEIGDANTSSDSADDGVTTPDSPNTELESWIKRLQLLNQIIETVMYALAAARYLGWL